MPQQMHSLYAHSVLAAGAITTRRFVGFDGNQATVQGQKVLGVARSAAAQGQYAPVDCIGSAVVESGGVLAAGNAVICDAQGRAIANTGALKIAAGAVAVTSVAANGAADLAGSDLPEYVIGDVAPGEAASGAGQFVEIIFRR